LAFPYTTCCHTCSVEDEHHNGYESNSADGYDLPSVGDHEGPYPDETKEEYMYDPNFAPYGQNSHAAAAPAQPRSRGPEAFTKKLKTSSATDQGTVLGGPTFFYDQFKEELRHEVARDDYHRMGEGEYERHSLQEEYYYGDGQRDRREEGPYGRDDMEGDSGDGRYGYDYGILYQGAVCWN
jgi:hypothetical protein